jgi:uncharacterized protein YdeI (YjbR/CyaY-like superfamily)
VTAEDQRAWRRWLQANHSRVDGVWVKFAKKGSPTPTVSYAEAIEEALCFGWIDGQVRRFDERFYLQRFTPRRKRSKWSQINREKATQLIDEGRMQAPGLAQIEAAQADGRWEAAYPAQSQATVPEDFQRALEADPKAKEFFATLSGSTRYAFLYRLHNVTTADRRAKRIADYVERLSSRRTLDS